MNKKFFILITILIAPSAFCCTFPNSGPEFDKLIEITKLKDAGEFHIEIPRLSSPKKPELYIETYTIESYYILTNGQVKKSLDSGVTVSSDDYDREWAASQPKNVEKLLSLNIENDRVFKKINVTLKEGLVHRIYAYWPVECCLCSSHAYSELLENI